MHELSVALGLLENLTDAAETQGFERVTAVRLRIGTLSGIAPDALRFSWGLASAGTLADGSELQIEAVPLAVFCERCERESTPDPGVGLVCAECGTISSRIVRGRELDLVAVEVPE